MFGGHEVQVMLTQGEHTVYMRHIYTKQDVCTTRDTVGDEKNFTRKGCLLFFFPNYKKRVRLIDSNVYKTRLVPGLTPAVFFFIWPFFPSSSIHRHSRRGGNRGGRLVCLLVVFSSPLFSSPRCTSFSKQNIYQEETLSVGQPDRSSL